MGRMERRHQRKSSKTRIWSVLPSKSIIGKLFIAGILFLLLFLLVFNIFIWTSDVSELENPVPQPTIIYDQNGEIASKLSSSSIEGVRIEKIPKDVIHAVISTEDQRFYKHNGVNYVGIVRALFQNMISGEVVAGGSTITQQLAKNVFLTHERTYTRKVKELILTKKIERTYTKDEIMEGYLNSIYFGEGAWGIGRAAKVYFGKNVSELTLSESAMLAGLIKAPSVLNPIKNLNKAVERRNIVLSLMENEGYITQSDVEAARNETIVLDNRKLEDEYKGKYPYYVDHLIEEAINKYNLTENEILSGGLRIYTELNPTIQNNVEKVFRNDALFPTSPTDQLVQAGGIFINPSTGGINALVGGRGEHTFRGFNHATQLIRQPGSVMKPLAVYTPALEKGYEPYDLLEDRPLNINGYQPNNYDLQFRGQVTMYDAVVHSYNVPAVWLLNEIGLSSGLNAVERFGIPLQEEDHELGIALGGMNKGTSPLLMAQAFSTFANAGLMVEAHAIGRIEDAGGELISEWQKNASRVTDQVVAEKITYMLKGVIENGTGINAHVNGIEVAGKTGTTEVPYTTNGAKDHWFVGYTPDLVGAIWLGYDKTDETHFLSSSSGQTVTVLFSKIVTQSASELGKKAFDLSIIKDKYRKELEKKKEEKERKREEQEEKERELKEEEKERERERKEEEKGREKEQKEAEKEREKRQKEREKEQKKNRKNRFEDEDEEDEDED